MPPVSVSAESPVSGGGCAVGSGPVVHPGAPSVALTPPVCVSAEPPVSVLQPMAPTPAEDVNSDDSDEIVLAPSLPTRKSACLP